MEYKRIIIAGASSGIGEGLVHAFAGEDCLIGITGRREELLKKIETSYPQKIRIRSFDVAQEDADLQLGKLIEELGGMDLFIITAGTGWRNPDLEKGKEMTTLKTNVVGFTQMVLFAFNYFKKQGYGHLVGTSSIAGLRGLDICPSYSASKGFEALYLECLRRKSNVEKLNITVTTLIPGFVNTVMAQGDSIFWRAEVDVAAQQIKKGILKKKDKVFVTKRWRYVAWLLQHIPNFIFKNVKW